jgi:predicted TIM-barrel fold metal-dependent hydrolase
MDDRENGGPVERIPIVDADAHINEPVVRPGPPEDEMMPWADLAKHYPGWQQPGRSGGEIVNLIEEKLYPTQEGRGRGVPVASAMHPAAAEGALSLDARIRDIDAEGIDVQVLYGGLSIGASTFEDRGFAADFCRAYNDWLVEVCSRHPGRLKAVAVVPIQHVEEAINELRRTANLGVVGVMIPPVVGDRNLDDPALLPFFEATAALDTAVAVHGAPGMNVPLPGAERFDNYAQVHCLSFPVDQMVAVTALAMGGVLDRFPSLRVAFLESGIGWVPYFVHRMADHKEKRGDLLPHMTSDPRELIERGQCFFSFECDEHLLEPYVEHLGADSLVFSSDYPHWDCNYPGSVETARAISKGLGEDVTAKILGGNAIRLYGLDRVAA